MTLHVSLTVGLTVLASILASVGLLVGVPRRPTTRARRGTPPRWPLRALVPLLPLGLVGAAALPFAGSATVLVSVALTWATTLVWLPATRRWGGWAHAAWSLLFSAGAGYLLAMAAWTATSGLTGAALAAAGVLWVLELLAVVLLLAYGWEAFDVLGSRRWTRRLAPGATEVSPNRTDLPFVSVLLPTSGEPSDEVLRTLASLDELDYPRHEVVVAHAGPDDGRVEAFCRQHEATFRFHRLETDGEPVSRAALLNHAEAHADYRAEVIGLVEPGHVVDPDWLLGTVGAFDDAEVGFVQTRHDFSDWEDVPYLRRLYFGYDYFVAVSQPSRDERNSAVFGRAMGLVRREALVDVGRWDEWCVTEDTELSLRLLEVGWAGHHVDRAFGRGAMPLTFAAVKAERFRWAFGAMQTLRRHWRLLLPWSRGSRLTQRQRLAHTAGAVQWVGDLLGLAFSFVVVASLVDAAFGGGLVARRLGGLLVVAVPALILVGMLRSVVMVRVVSEGASWRDALGVFLTWTSLSWVVSLATLRGLFERRPAALRTGDQRGRSPLAVALRTNRAEVAGALLALGAVAAAVVVHPGWVALGLSLLLVLPVAGWLTAPVNTVAALRATLPPALDRARAAEVAPTRRPGQSRVRGAVATAFALSLAGAVVAVVVQPTSEQTPRASAVPELPMPPGVADGPSVDTPVEQTGTPTPVSTSTGTPTPSPTSTRVARSATRTATPSATTAAPTVTGTPVPTTTTAPTKTPPGKAKGKPASPTPTTSTPTSTPTTSAPQQSPALSVSLDLLGNPVTATVTLP